MRLRIFHILEYPFKVVGNSLTASDHPELGSYIWSIKILYSIHSTIFVSPIYLSYDENLKHYVLKSCHIIQRIISWAVLCLTSLSIVNNLRIAGKVLVNDTSYIVSYFDFMNILVLNVFIYIHMHLHWIRVDLLNNWIIKLQTSPLVQFCTLPVWKAKLFAAGIGFTSIYIAVVWTLTMFDLNFLSVHLVYANSGPIAGQLFWLSESKATILDASWVGTLLRCLTIIARLYDAIYIHVALNAFIPIHSFCLYNLTTNFVNALLRGTKIPRDEVLSLYSEYKSVINTVNSFFGPYCFHFLGTTLCFHSVHLLDALNTTNATWKLNMYIYICYLLSFFGFPTKTLMAGRKIKRWLWKNQNFLRIPDVALKSVLYDITNDRLGICGNKFFVVSPEFTGSIYQLLLKFSLLNLEHSKLVEIIQSDSSTVSC